MLQSALKVDQIVDKARKEKMPAVAVTDRNNLFCMLEFANSAQARNLQPIHGIIINLKIKEIEGEILLIAKDKVGYQNLLYITKLLYDGKRKNIRLDYAELDKYNEGLILLSGYTGGLIGKLLLAKDKEGAEQICDLFKGTFASRFYLEIMRHGLGNEQRLEKDFINLAIEQNIPLVATNSVLFADIDMHNAHNVMLNIAAADPEHSNKVSNQCYFKSQAEMAVLFADLPGALQNSVNIAKRCSVMAENSDPMLPQFVEDANEQDVLKNDAKLGLENRLIKKFAKEKTSSEKQSELRKQYFTQLDYELDIICKMDFAGYFLIVADLIKWSKANDIAVGPGRGSGAGSIVAWSLLITDLDPIAFRLIFERFLNPERVSMPDFDIDFCQERRHEVIEYVKSKYGEDRVAQIITFGKMQAKAVIKDVSRVMGLGYSISERLTTLVPFNAVSPVTLSQAIKEVPELKDAAAGKGLYNVDGEEDLIEEVLDNALILEGLHRHVSVHAAGIVIGSTELVKILPLYRMPGEDMPVIQYSMKYAEMAGLVKFDFLGLQTLTTISKCIGMLEKRGIEIDLDDIPLKDPKTFENLARGEGVGVFQFESVGMRDTLRKMQPDCLEDLIALGALYRPGPMDNIPTYIACKHGKQKPDYLHPALQDILKETYGVIIYQEQVLEIARVLAGYSLGAADLLRRAMGKKIKSEMEAQRKMFVEGAKNNGIEEEQAEDIFSTVAKFAGYGFNKAHAAAYAMISYQTAYLKANYTAEFIVANLNLELNDSDKINSFIQEARYYELSLVNPDINSSKAIFTINEEGAIEFALAAIKNISQNVGDHINQELQKNGPFKSVVNFIERLDHKFINKKILENLVKAGCFDKLHANRNSLIQSVPKLMAHGMIKHQDRLNKQISLIKVKDEHLLDEVEDISLYDRSFQEFEVLGVFLDYHPISSYRNILKQKGIVDSEYINKEFKEKNGHIKIAGVIQKIDSRMSSRGRFVIIQMSDEFGNFDTTIFNEDIMKKYSELIAVKSPVIVTCDLYKDEGGYRLTLLKLEAVEDVYKKISHNLEIFADSEEDLEKIMKELEKHKNLENSDIAINMLLSYKDYKIKIQIPNIELPVEAVRALEQYQIAE